MVLNWKSGGVLLGLVFLLAVTLVKPVGVSTEFVLADGIVWKMFDPGLVYQSADAKSGYASTNAYLNSSGGKMAKSVANPLNYGILFVVSIMIGAAVSAFLRGGVAQSERTMPPIWRANFGDSPAKRYFVAFVSGFLVLYGARMAGGCTSGHMMSGMMQTALSGYIFAAGAFLAGIPVAIFLFNREA